MFLTLTYRPENLPKDGSLQPKHFQDFMKRYRFWLEHKRIRFFHCGEYGEKNDRPHYHALIFGHRFKDLELHTKINGNSLYTSEKLNELWGHGYCLIGDVTFESAAYVARYVTKKITGEKALHHYNEIDLETGEILKERRPEYVTMSRRPGIGKTWFEAYSGDVYPLDEVIIRGKKMKPPRYYNSLEEKLDPDEYFRIKAARIAAAKKPEVQKDNTWDRLQVKEKCKLKQFELLKRNYEK